MFQKGKSGFLGRHHSQETKEKIRNAFKGIPRPEAIKKKISEAQKGEKSVHWKGGYASRRETQYRSFIAMRRRARKKNNGGSHTFGEWENLKAQYNWTCPCCKKQEPEIKLTEDHIVPLSRGGSDNIENIQPLCKQCNLHKMTKIIKFTIYD